MTNTCPRLIEVALPLKEISFESVRDKNIHHAHISHLHIWWARRPLPACRAVIFASLVFDPNHPQCPRTFSDAVARYLRDEIPNELKYYTRGRDKIRDADPYKPHGDTPDTLRNRLLAFIAKWSIDSFKFKNGQLAKDPSTSEIIDDRSLVKWETSDPTNPQGVAVLQIANELIKAANNGEVPTVFDPFSGGGAIPLEAARLGCQSIGNEYNPVAFVVSSASCILPQKYGVSGIREVLSTNFGVKSGAKQRVSNVLVHDFTWYAHRLLDDVRSEVSNYYPLEVNNEPPLAYLWARLIPCSNPSCRGDLPLIRSFVLASKEHRKVGLLLQVDKHDKKCSFEIIKGTNIKRAHGTKSKPKSPAICPHCEQPTSEEQIRIAARAGMMTAQLTAVCYRGDEGKAFRAVSSADVLAYEKIIEPDSSLLSEPILGGNKYMSPPLYGMTSWRQIFNKRQLFSIASFVKNLAQLKSDIYSEVSDHRYAEAIITYLALWVDRFASFNTTLCRWSSGSEIIKTPFGGQAIPMMWDYAEAVPHAESSGSALTQLEYMVNVLAHECAVDGVERKATRLIYGSAASLSAEIPKADCVVTDPPYDDAISYSDLSDFFYVWLKQTLSKEYPQLFTTPLTPKGEEIASLRHRFDGSVELARDHYRDMMERAFVGALGRLKKDGLISVMFAHQSSEAWAALIRALFRARLCPVATWPIATEMPKTALAQGTASLETSITVVCRPRLGEGVGAFKDVRAAVRTVVKDTIDRFWSLGIRGADLIVSCYGPAVSVFGQFEKVERADGSEVSIEELLEMARIAARDSIAGGFESDQVSAMYFCWATLYGASTQSWDDARLVVQIGGTETDAFELAGSNGIFITTGSECRLALLADRRNKKKLGHDRDSPLVDKLHHCLSLWLNEDRDSLVSYLCTHEIDERSLLWKLAQGLFDVLPHDSIDWRSIKALLSERSTLLSQSKAEEWQRTPQLGLELK